jgi:hypothetical protein
MEEPIMAGKRKARLVPTLEDLSKPSSWRLQHGGFADGERVADPETGTPISHRRAVDTLGQMLSNGTITREMHDAAAIFRVKFRTASLDALRPVSWDRVSGGGGDSVTERQVMARRQVGDAIEALGGFDSAAGSAVWHVVGTECSVREWAQRQGWGGRSIGAPQAQGMLIAALGVLAAHYGLGARRAA